jgi:hypothetical protein
MFLRMVVEEALEIAALGAFFAMILIWAGALAGA